MPRSPSLVRLLPFVLLAVLVAAGLYYSHPMALRLQNAGHVLLARSLYLISAVAGNPKSQYTLATLHIKGEGGPPNPASAAYWYARAARQGDVISAEALGELYSGGFEGMPKDGEKARHWYQQAAERNLPAAQYGLAALHASGELVPRDLTQAEFWYLKAARRGHAKAQLELGLLYLNQPGSSAGLKGAQVWLTEASRQAQTAAAARNHLSDLCRANPALNCQLTSAGPSLGALLPPARRRL